MSFCKLKFNNVNIILSLTLRYGMALDDIGYTVDENQTGALLFLLLYDQKPYNDLGLEKKHNNRGCLKQLWLNYINRD